MNQIQTVSKYIALSEEGLVSKLECPLDQGLLFCNIDLEDNVYLYCLSCEYKNTLGTKALDSMRKTVLDATRK